jgi:hypothetical protein
MKVSQRRSGGCWCGFSTLDVSPWKADRNARAAASERFFDGERKVAGKCNYFTAVVVVVM